MLGGGKGSWILGLLGDNDRPALGHLHSGSNNAVDLAKPIEYNCIFQGWLVSSLGIFNTCLT